MSLIEMPKGPRGVRFSNFRTLPSGEMEADIEIDESFRKQLFEQKGWTSGDDEDEAEFDQYVSYCFQLMLANIQKRKDESDEG